MTTLSESNQETGFCFLDDYNFGDLMDLRTEIDTRLIALRGEEIAALRRDVFAQAGRLGITPQELLEASEPKAPREKGEPLPAKYRDPVSGKTWSGKGKRPMWFDSERSHEFLI